MILGAVLAGGRSSRFGTDKGVAMLAGRSLIDHARDAIAPYVDLVVIVGRHDGIADLPASGFGPLGGIAGALDHADSRGCRSVLTIGCDMPRLPDGLIEALLRRAPAYCTDAPVLGHWSSTDGERLIAHLRKTDNRSVRGWARKIGALPIESPTPLTNINTREDLMAL